MNSRAIVGLHVVTRSGIAVGKVTSFDVDTDTGRISQFHIKSGGVTGLLTDELMVAWDQVIELTEEHLLVADAAVPSGSRVLAKVSPASANPSSSLMENG